MTRQDLQALQSLLIPDLREGGGVRGREVEGREWEEREQWREVEKEMEGEWMKRRRGTVGERDAHIAHSISVR